MKTKAFLFFIFFGFITLFAQDAGKYTLNNEEINELASKLSMKLLLNDSQVASVKSMLKTYSTEFQKIKSGSEESSYKNTQELVSSINSQIKALLDSKQKMKFDVLEKEWWVSVNNEIND